MSTLTDLRAPRDGEVQSKPYTIGQVTAEPGTTARGGIFCATAANGEPVEIPVIVVHGAHPGPVLAVGAGIHGDEYDSQQAVRELAAATDPATLHGTLVAMPCINTSAFAAATRESGVDHLNFNRIFPGDREGSLSMRLATTFIDEVVPVTDVFVDLHTGGQFGDITALAVVQRGHEEIARELGMAAGHPIIWKGGNWAGTARSSFLAAGKPAVTLETGGGTFRREVVARHYDSLVNIMRYLHMTDGEAVLRDSYEAVNATFARASAGGFYLEAAQPGDVVTEGTELATIVDHFGEVRERVLAPADGVVLWMRKIRTINPGEETVIFGPVEETIVP